MRPRTSFATDKIAVQLRVQQLLSRIAEFQFRSGRWMVGFCGVDLVALLFTVNTHEKGRV
jgi:hypothetical protein